MAYRSSEVSRNSAEKNMASDEYNF